MYSLFLHLSLISPSSPHLLPLSPPSSHQPFHTLYLSLSLSLYLSLSSRYPWLTHHRNVECTTNRHASFTELEIVSGQIIPTLQDTVNTDILERKGYFYMQHPSFKEEGGKSAIATHSPTSTSTASHMRTPTRRFS